MSRKLKLNEIENSLENNAVYVIEYDDNHNVEHKTLSLYCSAEIERTDRLWIFSDRAGELYGYYESDYGKKWDCEASNACSYNDEPMTKKILQRTEEALGYPDSTAIVLTRHGINDWEVYFPSCDYSVRGTRHDALKEINDLMADNNIKGGNRNVPQI